MFKQNIQKGIKFLDKKYPNWLDKIDVSELDLNKCNQCIMGQLVGHYLTAVREYGNIKMERFGFTVDITNHQPQDLNQLTKEWREAIKNKKAQTIS